MFGKFSNAIAGYGDDISITKLIQDEQVDYEAELAVVIGKDCKDVRIQDAWQYFLGYTCANDLSARFVTPASFKFTRMANLSTVGSGKLIQT